MKPNHEKCMAMNMTKLNQVRQNLRERENEAEKIRNY